LIDVTVITPTLPERATLLEQLADALARQTVPHAWLVRADNDNLGPARIRNELAAQADTTWLAFVDDDDLVYDNHLAALLENSNEADVVYSLCDVEGREWQPDHDCTHSALESHNTIPVTSMVRKDAFMRVGGFPLGVRDEDWALWRAMRHDNARIVCVHETTWLYRFHDVGRGNRTWWDG
jgi:glycosyltransferase involved in cell wall biosynthesis